MSAANRTELLELDQAPEGEGVQRLTDEEARAYFDAQATRLLGMSGVEFLRRLDAGEFADQVDLPGAVGYLAALSPFGR
jgi:hypothetical protein